jgi:glycine cleavage system H protein
MKEIGELDLPGDLYYSEDHEWARLEGAVVKIGITDYAQDQLGDITFVEMPDVGDVFEEEKEFGTLESTKAASEMLLPIAGEVTAVNTELEDSPELVNVSPYGDGWVIEIKPVDPADLENLMSRDVYRSMLEGLVD